ncbi:MAG: hypothetical protein HXY41_13385 [Chloroflexi bacterium]|nr:hypothetical protein [Chloroflexota bacterium]
MTDNENPEIVDVPEAEEGKSPLEAFIFHQRRALEEAGKALDALLPDGFKEHGSAASKEFIKGFQVLVDAAITEIEKATSTAEGKNDDEDRPSTTGKAKVKVQVD